MNPKWFGDSFDIVKRFFVETLHALGYQVIVDPMLTGEWNGMESNFYTFLKADHHGSQSEIKKALLLDPDTGIGARETAKHVTIAQISAHLEKYEIVFCFDQSFSRTGDASVKILEKLHLLKEGGGFGFYYDSHARFLFASKSKKILGLLEQQILSSGLPRTRLIKLNPDQ